MGVEYYKDGEDIMKMLQKIEINKTDWSHSNILGFKPVYFDRPYGIQDEDWGLSFRQRFRNAIPFLYLSNITKLF